MINSLIRITPLSTLIALHVFLLALSFQSPAQEVDSLRRLLADKELPDTSRVLLMSRLANAVYEHGDNESILIAAKGLSIAEKIKYEKGACFNALALANAYHQRSSFDTSNFYFHKGIHLNSKKTNVPMLLDCYIGLGRNFIHLSTKDSSRYYFDKALIVAKSNGDKKSEAAIYINYGVLFQSQGDYKKSLQYEIDAAKLYESLGDQEGLAKALGSIGNVEYLLGNFEEALKYSRESLSKVTKNTSAAIKAYPHRVMGRTFRKLKKLDSALNHYSVAINISKSSGDRLGVAELSQNIGNILYDQGDFQKAMHYYLLSLKLAKSVSSKTIAAYAYSSIGITYEELFQHAQALVYLDSSLLAAKVIGNAYLEMDAYGSMISVYEGQKNYKKALFYNQKYTLLNDSLNQAENHQLAEEARSKFELEKKEDQIVILKKDQELQNLALRQQQAMQVGFGIAAAALLIIAALAINRYRVINEAKRQLEIERMRNALARDLHDDIGSALSSITIMSQLAGSSSVYSQKILEQSSRIQESMSDIVWSINPMNDSFEKVVMKMKEFAAEILESKNIDYHFKEKGSLQADQLNIEKRKNIYLIFKEVLNNAAKYSLATAIFIHLFIEDHLLTLVVEDNGIGFDATQVKEGNGLKNIRARVETIQGSVTIQSTPGKGTSLTLKVALT